MIGVTSLDLWETSWLADMLDFSMYALSACRHVLNAVQKQTTQYLLNTAFGSKEKQFGNQPLRSLTRRTKIGRTLAGPSNEVCAFALQANANALLLKLRERPGSYAAAKVPVESCGGNVASDEVVTCHQPLGSMYSARDTLVTNKTRRTGFRLAAE